MDTKKFLIEYDRAETLVSMLDKLGIPKTNYSYSEDRRIFLSTDGARLTATLEKQGDNDHYCLFYDGQLIARTNHKQTSHQTYEKTFIEDALYQLTSSPGAVKGAEADVSYNQTKPLSSEEEGGELRKQEKILENQLQLLLQECNEELTRKDLPFERVELSELSRIREAIDKSSSATPDQKIGTLQTACNSLLELLQKMKSWPRAMISESKSQSESEQSAGKNQLTAQEKNKIQQLIKKLELDLARLPIPKNLSGTTWWLKTAKKEALQDLLKEDASSTTRKISFYKQDASYVLKGYFSRTKKLMNEIDKRLKKEQDSAEDPSASLSPSKK